MPGDELAHGGGDVGRKRVLEQIAGGADGDRRDHAFLVAEDGDHHDLGVGMHLPGLPDQLDAVAVRQLQVGEQHARRRGGERGAGLGQRAGRGDRKVAGVGQRIAQPPAGRRVVLDEQHRDGLVGLGR